MSRKTPNEPPQQNSLLRAMLVPILLFIGVLVIALLVGVFGSQLAGNGADTSGSGNQARDGKTLDAETMARFRNEWDELGVAYGPEDAPVTVREFADYQCPACGAFADTAKQLRETFADDGDVRFIFFDFPLPMHQHAREAAIAARCAGRQDQYWAFHKELFDNQSSWSQQSDPTSAFLDYAVSAGARAEPLRRCLEQRGTEPLVAENARIAQRIGVMSTPTILVGPRVFAGVTQYDRLANEIENQLAAPASD